MAIICRSGAWLFLDSTPVTSCPPEASGQAASQVTFPFRAACSPRDVKTFPLRRSNGAPGQADLCRSSPAIA